MSTTAGSNVSELDWKTKNEGLRAKLEKEATDLILEYERKMEVITNPDSGFPEISSLLGVELDPTITLTKEKAKELLKPLDEGLVAALKVIKEKLLKIENNWDDELIEYGEFEVMMSDKWVDKDYLVKKYPLKDHPNTD